MKASILKVPGRCSVVGWPAPVSNPSAIRPAVSQTQCLRRDKPIGTQSTENGVNSYDMLRGFNKFAKQNSVIRVQCQGKRKGETNIVWC